MADTTTIHLCDSTVNPVMGCDGCELWNSTRRSCYAAILHERHAGVNPGYATCFDRVERFPGRMAKAAKLSDLTGLRRRSKPWLDGRPRMVFVSDMGDALSASVSFEYIEAEIVNTVTSPAGRRHIWLWLTKRPKRMAQFSTWLADWRVPWPTNLWPGTTITAGSTIERLDALLAVGDERTTRYLSLEPQLESIDILRYLTGLDWIIQGGESGSDARPFELSWARQLQDHCREAGVACFLKQLGSNPTFEGKPLRFEDRHGGNWAEWPSDLRVREVPTAVVSDEQPCPAVSNTAKPTVLSPREQCGQMMQGTKFYTIGYGGRKPGEFVSLLTANGIKTIVDVRLSPRGYLGCYTRAKDPSKGIEGMLARAGVKYVWLAELGNSFKDLDSWAQAYRDHLDQIGDGLMEMLESVTAPFCLMCGEKRVADCHRKLIADRLVEAGAEIEHVE